MGDANDLLAQLVANSAKQKQIVALLQQIKQPPPVQVEYRPAAPADADIRAEKVQKINFNIRKSNRLKPFRVSADSDIKLFLKRFDEELQNMKAMVGLNGVLTKEEYVPIFRACLDFPIVERVGQVLTSMGKTRDSIPIVELTNRPGAS